MTRRQSAESTWPTSFISAAEPAELRDRFTETRPGERPGAKGIGESGTIGATPRAQRSVTRWRTRVRHIDMPTTPVRVWSAINDAVTGHGTAKGTLRCR